MIKYKEIDPDGAKLATCWNNTKLRWLKEQPNWSEFILAMENKGIVKWFCDEFYLIYKNRHIGFWDEKDFFKYVEIKLWEIYLNILQIYVGIGHINLDDIVNQALTFSKNTVGFKENQGNYQSSSWGDQSGNVYQTHEENTHNVTVNGNELIAIKNVLNNGLKISIDKYLEKFDRLFITYFRWGDCCD